MEKEQKFLGKKREFRADFDKINEIIKDIDSNKKKKHDNTNKKDIFIVDKPYVIHVVVDNDYVHQKEFSFKVSYDLDQAKKDIKKSERYVLDKMENISKNFHDGNYHYRAYIETYCIQIVKDEAITDKKFFLYLPKGATEKTLKSNVKEYMKKNSWAYVLERLDCIKDVLADNKKYYQAFVFDSFILNNVAASQSDYVKNWYELLGNEFEAKFDSKIQQTTVKNLDEYYASSDSDNTDNKIKIDHRNQDNSDNSDNTDSKIKKEVKKQIKRIKFFKSILNTMRRLTGSLECQNLNHQMIIVLEIIKEFCRSTKSKYQFELYVPFLTVNNLKYEKQYYNSNKFKEIKGESQESNQQTKASYTCQCKGKDFFIVAKARNGAYFDLENELFELVGKGKLKAILEFISNNLKLEKNNDLQKELGPVNMK
jgi:hypothetical protein